MIGFALAGAPTQVVIEAQIKTADAMLRVPVLTLILAPGEGACRSTVKSTQVRLRPGVLPHTLGPWKKRLESLEGAGIAGACPEVTPRDSAAATVLSLLRHQHREVTDTMPPTRSLTLFGVTVEQTSGDGGLLGWTADIQPGTGGWWLLGLRGHGRVENHRYHANIMVDWQVDGEKVRHGELEISVAWSSNAAIE